MPRSITPPNIPVPRPHRWTSAALSVELNELRKKDSCLNEKQLSRNSNSSWQILLDNDVMDSEVSDIPSDSTQSVQDGIDRSFEEPEVVCVCVCVCVRVYLQARLPVELKVS